MKQTVTMPALSDTMNIGRLAKWLKKPGDPVKKGEALAEVETDKAVMEVEAFYDGFLAGPLAPVDTDLRLGTPIAYIVDTAAEAVSVAPMAPPTPGAMTLRTAAPTSAAAPTPSIAPSPAAPPGAARASPYARAQAQKFAAAGLSEGPPHRIERPSTLRDAVAHNMITSAATPTFRLIAQLPFEPLHKAAKEKNMSVTPLLARACALTVAAHPLFNAVYTPDGLAQRERVDIGIAVDIPDGLVTPVLRDAARRPLAELAADWSTLRDKLKTRHLTPQDYRGATFYLSDLGTFPVVQSFDSIVPAGASAILSVAAARPEGAMFTLACDHRVVFGADGARFLTTLGMWLSDPGKLVGWH